MNIKFSDFVKKISPNYFQDKNIKKFVKSTPEYIKNINKYNEIKNPKIILLDPIAKQPIHAPVIDYNIFKNSLNKSKNNEYNIIKNKIIELKNKIQNKIEKKKMQKKKKEPKKNKNIKIKKVVKI